MPIPFSIKIRMAIFPPPELQAALAERTGRTQKGLISLMFEVLDVDKDGKVSMDELASLAM